MYTDLLVESVRAGSEVSVDAALSKYGKGLDKLNTVGVSSLQVSVWRNHLPILEKLLEAGAAVDVPDLESGWTAMHRALYLGRLCAAAKLVTAGAHLNIGDVQGRTPLDLLSYELKGYLHFPSSSAVSTRVKVVGVRVDSNHVSLVPALTRTMSEPDAECKHLVFGWGSGANYQLGIGSVDVHLTPTRIDALQHVNVVQVAASKYHSAALTSSGQVYTWGWGRGGRLGHPDSLIHTKLSALLLPRLVAGLGRRAVVCIAAGKHHTLVCTTAGEVFAWGSNKHSCLGVPPSEVDMQPTPRKVTSIQHKRVVAVAAARKHSAALSHKGELYTWGANPEGQLGYPTPDSSYNPHPRMVENLKGRPLVAVSMAKRHTVALTVDGEVYTWGYRAHIPRRVKLEGSRDIARVAPVNATTSSAPGATASQSSTSSRKQVSFHRGQSDVTRPIGTAIAAGEVHTSVLIHTGEVLMWHSADSALAVQEIGGQLAGKRVTYISAGRTRTAAVTDHGDVYMWEGSLPRYKPDNTIATTPGSAGRADLSTTPPGRSLSNSNLAGSLDQTSSRSLSQLHAGALSTSVGGSVGTGGLFTGPGGSNPVLTPSATCSTSGAAVQPERILGLKRACAVAVGEKHSLALQSWSAPPLPNAVALQRSLSAKNLGAHGFRGEREDDSDDDLMGSESCGSESLDMDGEDDDFRVLNVEGAGVSRSGASWEGQGGSSWERERAGSSPGRGGYMTHNDPAAASGSWRTPFPDPSTSPAYPIGSWGGLPSPSPGVGWLQDGLTPASGGSAVPSLQDIMQLVVAREVVEPRTVLPILELADIMGASMLRDHCMGVALRNLDAVILEARWSLASLPERLLAELEGHYRQTFLRSPSPRSTQPVPGVSPRGHATPVQMREPGQPRASSPQPGSSPLGVSFMESIPVVLQGEKRETSRPRLQSSRRPSAPPAWLTHTAHTCFGPLPLAEQAAALQRAKEHLMNPVGAPANNSHTNEGPGAGVGTEGGEREGGDDSGVSEREQERKEEQEVRGRMLRSVRKKLTQIDELRERLNAGDVLDVQQREKLGLGALMWQAVSMLEQGVPVAEVQHVLDTGKAGMEPLSRPLSQAAQSEGAAQSKEGASSSSSAVQQTTQAGADEVPSASTSSSRTPHTPGLATSVIETAISTPTSSSSKPQARKAARKGDLSEFLSGVLEKKKPETSKAKGESSKSKEEAKNKGPAWGGAGIVRAQAGDGGDGSSAASSTGRSWPGLAVPPEAPATPETPSPLTVGSTSVPFSSLSPSPTTPAPRHAKTSHSTTPSTISPAGPSPTPSTTAYHPSKPISTPTSSLSFPKPGTRPPSAALSSGTLSLADFVKPDARKTARKKQGEAGPGSSPASKGPAWGGLAGSSPPSKSFMDILEEQQKQQHKGTPSWGPGQSKTAAGGGKSAAPPVRPAPPPNSKWYVSTPATAPLQALQHIQKEEVAIQQLQKLYGGNVQVKVVQTQKD